MIIDNHDEDCSGAECDFHGCYALPDNNPVVAAVIALWESEQGWIPGCSRGRLAEALGVPVERLRTAQQIQGNTHWEDALLPAPILDRYGEPIGEIDPEDSEVIMEGGEVINRETARWYAEAELNVVNRDNTLTKYHADGTVTQHRKDGTTFEREN